MKIQVEFTVPDGDYCINGNDECLYLSNDGISVDCELFLRELNYQKKGPAKCAECKNPREKA